MCVFEEMIREHNEHHLVCESCEGVCVCGVSARPPHLVPQGFCVADIFAKALGAYVFVGGGEIVDCRPRGTTVTALVVLACVKSIGCIYAIPCGSPGAPNYSAANALPHVLPLCRYTWRADLRTLCLLSGTNKGNQHIRLDIILC